MFNLKKLQSILLISALITTSSSVPLQAAIRQQPHPVLTESNETYLALSWGDIWKKLRRKRKGGGGRGGAICAIAPAKLVDADSLHSKQGEILEIWSDRPLFLWNIPGGTVTRIELSRQGDKEAFWNRPIKGETRAVYDGEPLQPGQSYVWKLSASEPYPIETSVMFQVMEPETRDRISAELISIALVQQLKDPSPEALAMEKVHYFAERELWSDALRELYSVPNPSAELRNAIALLQAHDFCAEDEPNVSASQ
ncbi:DUF928 domain-containing protein [Coleofasciculus sp. FACHB-712]|uniref:DUF928 domain-containing protein n=1 Tax=Coleofasciculus sp. FACHB-712 TaxID=2692789 RepID=UPI001685F05E|nr:DUF928 domain-containing protein [Coleofasciculus sp. FACHB-712]MBD1944992.1 DUF928 domain-containing protein [Coleofasciculus sp. FACHB-712]